MGKSFSVPSVTKSRQEYVPGQQRSKLNISVENHLEFNCGCEFPHRFHRTAIGLFRQWIVCHKTSLRLWQRIILYSAPSTERVPALPPTICRLAELTAILGGP